MLEFLVTLRPSIGLSTVLARARALAAGGDTSQQTREYFAERKRKKRLEQKIV